MTSAMNREQWAQSSQGVVPSSAMTHAEIAHALQVICAAFGASVPTQYKVAALFVEGLAAAEKDQ